MPTLGSIFKSILLTQIPSFSIVITILIDILVSKKKLKKKRTYIFINESIALTSSNTTLFSG